MKLIDKAAVEAEIERRRNQEVQWMEKQGYTEYHQGLRDGYANILSFLDTIEMKEVDLDKEITDYLEEFIADPTKSYFRQAMLHFFELGVKAQKV